MTYRAFSFPAGLSCTYFHIPIMMDSKMKGRAKNNPRLFFAPSKMLP